MQIPHYALTLNVNAQQSTQTIIAKQFDSKSRYVDITLVADNKPIVLSNERVTLTTADRKTGETIALTDCKIVNNVIVAELTSDMLAVAAKLNCEITVYATTCGGIITSARFIVIVDGKLSTDVVERESDFSALQSALSDVANTSNRINEVATEVRPIAKGGTGATTAYDAAQSLKTAYLGAISTIPADSDLNDYTTNGTYDVNASAATTISNSPPTIGSYKLLVASTIFNGYLNQIAINPGRCEICMRTRSANDPYAWSAWRKITSQDTSITETGTWTPTLPAEKGTITTENVVYVYNGNTVYIKAHIKFNANVIETSANITGLPLYAASGGAALTIFPTTTNTLFAKVAGNTLTIKSTAQLSGEHIIVSGVYKI